MRPAPPPPPLPRWGVSASLTRAARGRRHRAQAADPDSVSPQDPPRCQIVVARLSARPVPALHVHIVKLGRVTHESKAPSLTSVRVGRHGADSWHAQGPGGTADAPAALGRRDRAQPASWRCLGSPGEAGVPWGADGAGGSQDQAGGAGCAGPPRPHGRRAQTAAWALWGPARPGTRCASPCPPRSDLGGERPRSSSWAALLSAPKVTFHSDSAGCCWAGLFLSRAQAAATRSAQAIGWALSPWALDHCPFRL